MAADVQNGTMLRTGVHVLLFVHHVYTMFVLATTEMGHSTNGDCIIVAKHSYSFLTFWNFMVQMLYLTMVVAIDMDRLQLLSLWTSIANNLKTARAYLLASIVGPFAIFIPIVFWFVYAIDRELIYPSAMDEVIPFSINISVHGVIILTAVVDFVFGCEYFPHNRKSLLLLWIFQLTYVSTLITTNYLHGVWVYGYLRKLTDFQRNLFFLCSLWSTVLFYYLCNAIQKQLEPIPGKRRLSGAISEPVRKKSVVANGSGSRSRVRVLRNFFDSASEPRRNYH